jgi:alkyl hydroperoxide reductase subunit AhpC
MIGDNAPDFEAMAYVHGRIDKVKLDDYKGKWLIIVFYPEDFSYVCPTEIQEFARDYPSFLDKGAEIVAISSDSEYTHRAWVMTDPRLKQVTYALVSDRSGEIAKSYGVLNGPRGEARRALVIVDPSRIIRYMVISDNQVGRSTKETYRVLSALQTEQMCAANWQPGQGTIEER